MPLASLFSDICRRSKLSFINPLHVSASLTEGEKKLCNNLMATSAGFPVRKIFRSSPSVILFSYLFLTFAAYQYALHTYYRDPTSFFFDPSRAYMRNYSLKREQQVDSFIETSNHSGNTLAIQPNGSLCLGIPNISRSAEQYLTRKIGSLLEGLSIERRSIHLIVFFALT